ncbi:MAG TPA: hypothetical protein VGM54_06825 [Chthoniobacter sp.]
MFLTRNLRVEVCGNMLEAPKWSFSRMLDTPAETPAPAPVVVQQAWANPLEEPARPARTYYRTIPVVPSTSIGPSTSFQNNKPTQ